MKKILMIGSTNLAVFKLRTELIQEMQSSGYEVVVAFQSGKLGDGKSIAKKNNCRFYEVEIDRRGKNPLNDIKLFKQYYKIIKKEKPDYVLTYNVKCNIYGGLASKINRIKYIPNITGLGKGLEDGGLTTFITLFLYRHSINKASCIFFQNVRDRDFFIHNRISCKRNVILPGSGVNLSEYCLATYPKRKKIIFLFIGRIMKAKGIDEYLEAAKEIRKKYKNVEFQICGYYEENYRNKMNSYMSDGTIVYNGLVNDVRKYINNCNCVVLPSYHPEGIANVLLEAAACGRPVITTNRIGCKETVVDNVSGYLIEEKNTEDLIKKLSDFLQLSSTEQEKMGLNGRKHVEKVFDRSIVVNEYMKIINEDGE